ncbi:hypothetical protein D3C85_1398750 [compost metagenome]
MVWLWIEDAVTTADPDALPALMPISTPNPVAAEAGLTGVPMEKAKMTAIAANARTTLVNSFFKLPTSFREASRQLLSE